MPPVPLRPPPIAVPKLKHVASTMPPEILTVPAPAPSPPPMPAPLSACASTVPPDRAAGAVFAAADRGPVRALRVDVAAGDRDRAAVAILAAADARALVRAGRGHVAARDRDGAARARVAAADAGAGVAPGPNGAAGNRDRAAVGEGAADAGPQVVAVRPHGAVRDRDPAAGSPEAAADAGRREAASRRHGAALDRDVAAVRPAGRVVGPAAADARAVRAAGRRDRAAPDRNRAAGGLVAAADAGAVVAALRGHGAALDRDGAGRLPGSAADGGRVSAAEDVERRPFGGLGEDERRRARRADAGQAVDGADEDVRAGEGQRDGAPAAFERHEARGAVGEREAAERRGAVGLRADADVRRRAGDREWAGVGEREDVFAGQERPALAAERGGVDAVHGHADAQQLRLGGRAGHGRGVVEPAGGEGVVAVRQVEERPAVGARDGGRHAGGLEAEDRRRLPDQQRGDRDAPLRPAVLADGVGRLVGAGLDREDVVRGAAAGEVFAAQDHAARRVRAREPQADRARGVRDDAT